jgi:hypothetical protein
MAPPKILSKKIGNRKSVTNRARLLQVGAAYRLSPAEYRKYLRDSPETLRRAIASGTWLPPEGVDLSQNMRPSGAPSLTQSSVESSSRDIDRLNERQKARQSLNNILKDNPELMSPDNVMLPNGRVIQRPNPDIDVIEARRRVSEQMTGGKQATDYERALAFGDILTRREQENAQQELQNFLTESLINTNSIPNNISQNKLKRAAGATTTVGVVNIKRGSNSSNNSKPDPLVPEGAKPVNNPDSSSSKPSTSSGKIYEGKFSDVQRQVIVDAGTKTDVVANARSRANRENNPIEAFKGILASQGISKDNITNIINSLSS